MGILAVIGGSGASRLGLQSSAGGSAASEPGGNPYGFLSAPIRHVEIAGIPCLYLPRHGDRHQIPPHRVNYRANLWALKQLGAERVVALAAVGGISPDLGPGAFAVPDQIIDYTHGREHSLYDGDAGAVEHVDFTSPYCDDLRRSLLDTCAAVGVSARDGGVYGATQGPRLETAAEIRRMERDGCHLVGMTGMPEASLARELGLCYATLAYVVNWAAGKGSGEITMDEIQAELDTCVGRAGAVIDSLVGGFAGGRTQEKSSAF